MFSKLLVFILFGVFYNTYNIQADQYTSKDGLQSIVTELEKDVQKGKALYFIRFCTEFITGSLNVIDQLIAKNEPKIKSLGGKLKKIRDVLLQDPDLKKYGELMNTKLDAWSEINATLYLHRDTLHSWLKDEAQKANDDLNLSAEILDAAKKIVENKKLQKTEM